ncbi:MAG: hypothetical protein KAX49_03950 [Halanaerobiales bacterium]|nr:hypothetical protein [Halanaerobiales bacterium]
MTGNNFNWKKNRKILGFGLFGLGVALVAEHYFSNGGGMDLEIIGHEIFGMIFIFIGFLLMIKWSQLPALIRAIKDRNWKAIFDEGEREKYRN